ncbi:hypothetical protein BJ741DRAFT_558875 [Chytriomyces cf. hyalinus JEL632]|nr:hypothetical protein BJ741DRAFT_558875 [Chytriomyces cf. hyalinus JEL632]
MAAKKLGKGMDFDLLVYNAQTNEEYPDDNQVIARNTSILVVRRPAAKHGRGTAARYVLGAGPPMAANIPSSNDTRSQSSAGGFSSGFGASSSGLFAGNNDAAKESEKETKDMTEAERAQAMFASQDAQNEQWQEQMAANRPQSFRGGYQGSFRGGGGGGFRGGRGGGQDGNSGAYHGHDSSYYANRPLPPGYVCYRCGKQGHHIAQCPTLGDINFDRPKLKRTTGIPQRFLQTLDEKEAGLGTGTGPDRGLMVTQDGKIVVAMTNDDAWQKLQKTAKTFGGVGDMHQMAPVLAEFKCPICSKNMKNAVDTPCCKKSYCDECKRKKKLMSKCCGILTWTPLKKKQVSVNI